jgi:hypothetical protein
VQRQFTDIRISAEQYAGGPRGRLRRFRAHGEPDVVPGSGDLCSPRKYPPDSLWAANEVISAKLFRTAGFELPG